MPAKHDTKNIAIHTTIKQDVYRYITKTAKERNITKNEIIHEAIELHKMNIQIEEISKQNEYLKSILYDYIKSILETDTKLHNVIKNIH